MGTNGNEWARMGTDGNGWQPRERMGTNGNGCAGSPVGLSRWEDRKINNSSTVKKTITNFVPWFVASKGPLGGASARFLGTLTGRVRVCLRADARVGAGVGG